MYLYKLLLYFSKNLKIIVLSFSVSEYLPTIEVLDFIRQLMYLTLNSYF